MNDALQFIGTFASIFSIPLAIILYLKASDARQNKVRLDIIRSLSYRIGEGKALDRIEIASVFNSKIRESKIRKPLFTEETILEDVIADAVSNPFLTSEQKTSIIKDVEVILESYSYTEAETNSEILRELIIKSSLHESEVRESQKRRHLLVTTFTTIAGLLTLVSTILAFMFGSDLPEMMGIFDGSWLSVSAVASVSVTVIASTLVAMVMVIIQKKDNRK